MEMMETECRTFPVGYFVTPKPPTQMAFPVSINKPESVNQTTSALRISILSRTSKMDEMKPKTRAFITCVVGTPAAANASTVVAVPGRKGVINCINSKQICIV